MGIHNGTLLKYSVWLQLVSTQHLLHVEAIFEQATLAIVYCIPVPVMA